MTAATPLPAVFWAHGNPLLTLSDNPYTRAWRALGKRLAPRVILVISAHWVTTGIQVTGAAWPPTLHDFGGFPQALYDIAYRAPGAPAFAAELAQRLDASIDPGRGLDHGAWTVLRHMYPDASVPVVQLSLDAQRTGDQHYALGAQLRSLRNEGVLIMGSGNVVHNLGFYGGAPAAYPWARRFTDTLRSHLLQKPSGPVCTPHAWGPDGTLAVPTPEHYWPLLYVLAARDEDEPLSFPTDGFEGGSLSMLSVLAGSA